MMTLKKMLLQAIPLLVILSATFPELLRIRAVGVDVNKLIPDTLNDSYGNKAGPDSNVDYATIGDNGDYKARGDGEIDLGVIGPFYALADSIVDTSFPGGFPYEMVSGVLDGSFDYLIENWQDIVLDNLGYIIAVAIGFLFIIIFPIVGFCFCCCRLCGNCGGSRKFDSPEKAGFNDKCGRMTAICMVFSMAAMSLTGAVLMYVTSDNVSTSLKDLGDTQIDKLDDVSTFFNSTVQQAEQLVGGNFNFTLEVLFRDLDNIGYLLGGPIRERVLSNTGLDATYDGIANLETDAQDLRDLLMILDKEKTNVIQTSEIFHNFTVDIKADVEDLATKYPDFNTSVTNRSFETTFSDDSKKLPVETVKIMTLNQSLNQGMSSLTEESRQNLEDIPERVQNETESERQQLKADVGQYSDETKKITENIRDMQNDVLGGIDFDGLKADGKDYVNTAVEYDQYRWYGGLGLACVMLLIVLLQLFGLLFGMCGSGISVLPSKRGALSNSGGNMLIASVAFVFIFGWLTMLVTTLLFTVGAPVDKYLCDSLKDLSVADKLLDEFEALGSTTGNGSWLGDKIFSGKGIDLKLSGVMSACQNGETVYSALKLEEAGVFNLSDILDYKKNFNLSKQLDKVNVDFQGINISGPVMSFLDRMKDFDSTMEYDKYSDTFSVNPVSLSQTFKNDLDNWLNHQNDTVKQDFQNITDQFTAYLNNEGAALNDSIAKMEDAIMKIKQITQQPPNNNLTVRTETLQDGLLDIEANLSAAADRAFKDSVKEYEERLTGIVDGFIADVEDAVKTELGKCTPLWNMYNDVVIYGICDSTVGALSGWWCATGWTTFFLLVASCASVRLARHFRKMDLSSSKGSSPRSSQSSVHHFSNKVYHSDKPNGVANRAFQADDGVQGLKF